MLHKNIKLSYLIASFSSSWFWYGIWIFYYLRFTNYAGVGLMETIYIATSTLMAIPAGVIADILGKKNTTIISFFLQVIGSLMIGLAPNFTFLAIAVTILTTGATLFSGTFEALIYDSLKEEKQEKLYNKIIANISSIRLISPAIAGAIGGYIYSINPSSPYFAVALFFFFGLITSLFLSEPSIDTDKYSFSQFIQQTKTGWRELTKNSIIIKQTILLTSIGVIAVIVNEVIDSMLGIEFGFNEAQMGVLWAVILLVSAGVSQLTPKINKLLTENRAVFVFGLIVSFSLIISPVVGLILGGTLLIIRNATITLYHNYSSILINHHTQSKYRATTLSTFRMFKNIPYMLCAYFIGFIADSVSAKYTAVLLGSILIIFLAMQYFVSKKAITKNTIA